MVNLAPDYDYSIGGLVRHKRYGYRGVVVGSDPRCLADDDWYYRNRSQPRRNQPWYHVLVHGAEHSTYSAQNNLDMDEGREQVIHPLTKVFFQYFSSGRYHPRADVTFPGSVSPDRTVL